MFSEKPFFTTPPDVCFCIKQTCKAVNTTSKFPVKAHILGKSTRFTCTEHLHKRYAMIVFYFDSKFCRTLMKK